MIGESNFLFYKFLQSLLIIEGIALSLKGTHHSYKSKLKRLLIKLKRPLSRGKSIIFWGHNKSLSIYLVIDYHYKNSMFTDCKLITSIE